MVGLSPQTSVSLRVSFDPCYTSDRVNLGNNKADAFNEGIDPIKGDPAPQSRIILRGNGFALHDSRNVNRGESPATYHFSLFNVAGWEIHRHLDCDVEQPKNNDKIRR